MGPGTHTRKEVPQMHKKLIAICGATTALAAFVVPVAVASPVLTSGGSAVAVGTEIKGVNTGVASFTASVETVCSTPKLLALKITANSGTKIKGEISEGSFPFTGTEPDGDCKGAFGTFRVLWKKLCLETATGTDSVVMTGCGANATLMTNATSLSPCKYSAASLTGSFVTNAAATLAFSGQKMKLAEGGAFCTSEFALDMHFDLQTSLGGALTIS
jgi:hypothetical protein